MLSGILSKSKKVVAALRPLIHLRHVARGARLLLYPGAHFHPKRGSRIKGEGTLELGSCYRGKCGVQSMLTMGERSVVQLRGHFDFFYGADIQLFDGGTLELGSGFINSGCKIRCRDRIAIGDGCVISHDFTVMDSNAHILDGSRGTAPVRIGDHVWVGTRVTVLPGVTIGEGAVIGAGAVVMENVPAHSLAAGVPARVIRENVTWRE